MKFEKITLIAVTFMFIRMNLKTSYDDLISEISHRYGNSPQLVKAIIKVESGFDPKAHRKTKHEDSRGLGQINANTARALGITKLDDLFIPEVNVETINKLLINLKKRNKSLPDIIAAYNAGSVKVDKSGKYINSSYVNNVYSRFLLYSVFLV